MKQYVQIPVFVMIRPRGGDFLYSDREVEVMKADIRLAKLYGADGLVFGALTKDGHIDKELCMSLVGKNLYQRPKPLMMIALNSPYTEKCNHRAGFSFTPAGTDNSPVLNTII